jgi:hypothetical protein
MPNTVYPTNQEIYIDPYNSKIFDFNNYQSRVYLGRSINQLLKVFGDNCIINGVEILEVILNNNILKVVISSGKLIIDTTLIEFKENTILEYDISDINVSNGFFVVSVSFNYLHNVYDNYAKFKLVFINNETHVSNDIFIEQDRIILTKIKIDSDEISYIKSNLSNNEYVTINNHLYKVYPVDNINKSLIKIVKELLN